jgi:quercetin dioxygenase-like cupin family protein
MLQFIMGIFLLAFSFCASCMTVTKVETAASVDGPVENFTGVVKVKRIISAESPSHTSTALVIFSKNARSAWHTHPLGQTLIVTKGSGRIQEWGRKMQTIKEGDVIWTPPGIKHWHGASPESEMSHFAIVETKDGKQVEWFEKVTDEQYLKLK